MKVIVEKMQQQHGSPPHVPTPETRAKVKSLASFGVAQELIATHIGIQAKTLRKRYRSELDNSALDANAAVAGKLFSAATQPDHSPASITAAIFWAKTRMGWKDTTSIEHVGKNGGPIAITHEEALKALEKDMAIAPVSLPHSD